MLAAEALRLAAIEVLCPTASIAADGPFPTLARHRVYDSAAIQIDDLEPGKAWTPCLSLHTDESRVERRGSTSTSSNGGATAVLIVVADLAVSAADDGGEAAIGIATEDPQARLVLGALCAQVRKALVYAPAGSPFRAIGYVDEVRTEAFSVPQFDMRWMRNTMRFSCTVKDDKFTDAPGLPSPAAELYAALPAGSYAKGKLAELDAAFAATTREALQSIIISTEGPVTALNRDASV